MLAYYALLRSGKLRNTNVIVPSVGWVTSIAPAMQFGFTPYMCEADPDTFGLDLNHLEDLLKRHQAQTVLLVQVLGVPHRMREVQALKDRYGFYLLEDACAAIGAEYEGRKVGTFGDMASFSFYFGHQMSTIEGGMVSCNDRRFADLLLMLRSHGWSKDLPGARHEELVEQYEIDDFHSPFVFYEPGFNLRSTDLNAFIGIEQVRKLDGMTGRRQANHDRYLQQLGGRFYTQRPPRDSKVASISFGLLADSPEQRKRIVRALVAEGVETRIFSAGNLGLHPFWINRYGKASFPVADRVHHCGFFLPNHASMTEEDVLHISRVVLEAA
ncbi:MAG: DegT/DnrJ/EryC1/StrS family aminotransferase [Nitrospira sp.]|nr:DegT/DnrJ/EryC1/StrS family aminotransferase [Nitrospira sp.]